MYTRRSLHHFAPKILWAMHPWEIQDLIPIEKYIHNARL